MVGTLRQDRIEARTSIFLLQSEQSGENKSLAYCATIKSSIIINLDDGNRITVERNRIRIPR